MEQRVELMIGGEYIRQQSAQRYQSFILRRWQVRESSFEQAPLWRFTVRDISAESQEHAFATLTELLEYLSAELTPSPNSV